MSDQVFMWLSALVALPVLVVSLWAARCNYLRYRTAHTSPPLDGIDLSEAAVVAHRAPRRWPPVDDVTDPRVAAAYASLADDRVTSYALIGEAMAVAGGAAMGTAIPGILEVRGVALFVGALAVAGAGILLRQAATRLWEPVLLRYRQRYAELTAEPLPAPRRGGLLGWFGR